MSASWTTRYTTISTLAGSGGRVAEGAVGDRPAGLAQRFDQAGEIGQMRGSGRARPASAGAGSAAAERVSVRAGRGADRGVGAPQHGQHALELAQGLAAGLLGRLERLLGRLGLGRADPAGGGDLDGHEADAVGHDVVELAGDADPLLGDGQLGAAVLLDLQPAGPVEQQAGARGR